MEYMMKRLNRRCVNALLPRRKVNAHKGEVGKLLFLCGSVGYTGAAALAAMGALRTGAGLVFLGVPESIYEIEAVKLTVPVVFPLPEHEGKLSVNAMEKIGQYLNRVDAVLIGPGIGVNADTMEIVRFVLENFDCPVVLDADGISVMSEHKDVLRDRKGATILTPHEGEFCRFAGLRTISDRKNDAYNLAKELGCVVVLKGYHTVITDGKTIFVNKTGNSGMAVGGSGDVLAGVIASLLGQGMKPLDAAACGVWLHGAAGDICAKHMGRYGMLPTDMLPVLSRLMK